MYTSREPKAGEAACALVRLIVHFCKKKLMVVVPSAAPIKEVKGEIVKVYNGVSSCAPTGSTTPGPSSLEIVELQNMYGCVLYDDYPVGNVLRDMAEVYALTEYDRTTPSMFSSPFLGALSPLGGYPCSLAPGLMLPGQNWPYPGVDSLGWSPVTFPSMVTAQHPGSAPTSTDCSPIPHSSQRPPKSGAGTPVTPGAGEALTTTVISPQSLVTPAAAGPITTTVVSPPSLLTRPLAYDTPSVRSPSTACLPESPVPSVVSISSHTKENQPCGKHLGKSVKEPHGKHSGKSAKEPRGKHSGKSAKEPRGKHSGESEKEPRGKPSDDSEIDFVEDFTDKDTTVEANRLPDSTRTLHTSQTMIASEIPENSVESTSTVDGLATSKGANTETHSASCETLPADLSEEEDSQTQMSQVAAESTTLRKKHSCSSTYQDDNTQCSATPKKKSRTNDVSSRERTQASDDGEEEKVANTVSPNRSMLSGRSLRRSTLNVRKASISQKLQRNPASVKSHDGSPLSRISEMREKSADTDTARTSRESSLSSTSTSATAQDENRSRRQLGREFARAESESINSSATSRVPSREMSWHELRGAHSDNPQSSHAHKPTARPTARPTPRKKTSRTKCGRKASEPISSKSKIRTSSATVRIECVVHHGGNNQVGTPTKQRSTTHDSATASRKAVLQNQEKDVQRADDSHGTRTLSFTTESRDPGAASRDEGLEADSSLFVSGGNAHDRDLHESEAIAGIHKALGLRITNVCSLKDSLLSGDDESDTMMETMPAANGASIDSQRSAASQELSIGESFDSSLAVKVKEGSSVSEDGANLDDTLSNPHQSSQGTMRTGSEEEVQPNRIMTSDSTTSALPKASEASGSWGRSISDEGQPEGSSDAVLAMDTQDLEDTMAVVRSVPMEIIPETGDSLSEADDEPTSPEIPAVKPFRIGVLCSEVAERNVRSSGLAVLVSSEKAVQEANEGLQVLSASELQSSSSALVIRQTDPTTKPPCDEATIGEAPSTSSTMTDPLKPTKKKRESKKPVISIAGTSKVPKTCDETAVDILQPSCGAEQDMLPKKLKKKKRKKAKSAHESSTDMGSSTEATTSDSRKKSKRESKHTKLKDIIEPTQSTADTQSQTKPNLPMLAGTSYDDMLTPEHISLPEESHVDSSVRKADEAASGTEARQYKSVSGSRKKLKKERKHERRDNTKERNLSVEGTQSEAELCQLRATGTSTDHCQPQDKAVSPKNPFDVSLEHDNCGMTSSTETAEYSASKSVRKKLKKERKHARMLEVTDTTLSKEGTRLESDAVTSKDTGASMINSTSQNQIVISDDSLLQKTSEVMSSTEAGGYRMSKSAKKSKKSKKDGRHERMKGKETKETMAPMEDVQSEVGTSTPTVPETRTDDLQPRGAVSVLPKASPGDTTVHKPHRLTGSRTSGRQATVTTAVEDVPLSEDSSSDSDSSSAEEGSKPAIGNGLGLAVQQKNPRKQSSLAALLDYRQKKLPTIASTNARASGKATVGRQPCQRRFSSEASMKLFTLTRTPRGALNSSTPFKRKRHLSSVMAHSSPQLKKRPRTHKESKMQASPHIDLSHEELELSKNATSDLSVLLNDEQLWDKE